MTESSKAVFLSYASEDADAARRICEALHRSGIEVWFDESELRGGDAWDQKIRKQIRDCALFIPIISANTAARREGYFRLEWGLAEQRAQMIARNMAFIVPVCVDGTLETSEDVPESIRRVQWTRLPDGDTRPSFCQRVAALLAGTEKPAATPEVGKPGSATATSRIASLWILTCVTIIVIAAVALRPWQLFRPSPAAVPMASSVPARALTAIPDRSIAVLPFVDMSEKKDQEYFSDGLSEELIDLLARNRNLQVTARTSSFYFKGKQATIAEIAKTLGVANVLEGSVRKSGNTLRITAQLIRASDGYHLWSETYDRNLDDLFKVQDAIAGEVVATLKVLLGAVATSPAADTPSIEANDLYLRAAFLRAHGAASDFNQAADLLARAVAVDPSFARAWSMLSRIKLSQFYNGTIPASQFERARLEGRRAAEKAVALAPDLTEPHLALGRAYLMLDADPVRADAEFHRALEIDPRNADAMVQLSLIALLRGRIEEHARMMEQALALDPLDLNIMTLLGQAYLNNGDPAAAEQIFRRERELAPARIGANSRLGTALLMLGQPKEALELMQKDAPDYYGRQWVRAMVYPALGRKLEADEIVAALDKDPGTLDPVEVAEIHAARGEMDLAFDWLDRQYRTDPKKLLMLGGNYFLRPLRSDPRFQALRRRLNLPE
jgi:adenylate cyclase